MKLQIRLVTLVFLVALVSGCLQSASIRSDPSGEPPAAQAVHVVVADVDSGANVLHPAFRVESTAHPSTFLHGYPADARSIAIEVRDTWAESVEANRAALGALRGSDDLFWIPGTKFIGLRADPKDESPIFHPRGTDNVHGARTSSEVAGIGYSHAPEAWLMSLDLQADRPGEPLPPGVNVNPTVFEKAGHWFRYAADQPYVDVIHVALQNFQPMSPDLPAPLASYHALAGQAEAVQYALAKGKFIAAAGGNTHGLSSEWNSWSGPPGVLAVGANDNCGWYQSASHNPDVVMDGGDTIAVQTGGYGNSSFGGTSGASSLAAGYAAHLIYEARAALGHDATQSGFLVAVPEDRSRPATGPLADGRLTVLELHETIRKTADPKSHASRFDGGQRGCNEEQNQTSDPEKIYEHMGYGEISEHTMPHAVAVLLGQKAMPVRSEDKYYEAGLARRTLYWQTLPQVSSAE